MQEELRSPSPWNRPPARLLLVEDDEKPAGTLARGLEHEGYTVDVAHTAHDARS